MNSSADHVARDEEWLGTLAMQFRRTSSRVERERIAWEYATTVERLIRSGGWENAPPPEDQLPDDFMPASFFAFWS